MRFQVVGGLAARAYGGTRPVVDIDDRVTRRYEAIDEDERLWLPGRGDLVRLRTWDIFDRYLPAGQRVIDIGGGPGTHAAYLAAKGHTVTTIDPVGRHVEAARARSRSQPEAPFRVEQADARRLPLADESVDVALMMGPLYHLIDPHERLAALREAARVVRPGGHIMAEIISRHAWLIEATIRDMLPEPTIWQDFERNIGRGLSQDPDSHADGGFFAYFHRPDELAAELQSSGFTDVVLVAVEGFALLLGDIAERMNDPTNVLRAVRMTETEPSMLGVSSHIIGWARKPSTR